MEFDTKIDLSTDETSILGLKVGRCNSDYFNESSLYEQITQENYDLCRLKVPAEDEMAAYRLNKIGLPGFFSGSIRRYKTNIIEPPSGSYNFPDLIFEQYDGSQNDLLKRMLVGTWGTYPIGYYRTPYLHDIVSKEMEIECVFQYYKKHNLTRDYPNNSIMFIRHGDLYVGFFALNIVNKNLESHIGGILEPYRKSGYFLDKLRFIKEYCISHQLEHFIFGARNENAEVQRIFQYVGFQPRGNENVFHIPSLLTYSQMEPIIKEIDCVNDKRRLYQVLLSQSLELMDNNISEDMNFSFQLNQSGLIQSKKPLNVRFSFPILTANESLIVLKANSEHKVALLGYMRAVKK